LNFFDWFSKNNAISNYTYIRTVAADLLNGQTDGQRNILN